MARFAARNHMPRHWLPIESGMRPRRARKVVFDGTPAVPRVFVPKNLKSAPAADRNNTLDGQSWKNTKNACTPCDWCIRRLAARKRLRGESPIGQTRHACAAGASAYGTGLPSWNRTDAAVASRIRRVATERVEVSPATDVTKYVVFPHDPANVWRQTAEATNQQPSFRNPRPASTPDHGGSPRGPQGTDRQPSW